VNYRETLNALFWVLETCNAADSSGAQPWQIPEDANSRGGAYGHVRNAIVALAGEEIVAKWAETGGIDWNLVNRPR
jgi:hypothetical protein